MRRARNSSLILLLLVGCGSDGDDPPAIVFGPLGVTSHAGAAEVVVDLDREAWGGIEVVEEGVVVEVLEGESNGLSHRLFVDRLIRGVGRQVRPFAVLASGERVRGSSQVLLPDETAQPLGDEFATSNLDRRRWQVEDVHGLATLSLAEDEGERTLEVTLPSGVPYLSWHQGNEGLRMLENVSDEDLQVEVKSLHGMAVSGTGHGIHFEEDFENWMRFDYGWNGGRLEVFAARFENGALVEHFVEGIHEGPWLEGDALHMRVERAGDTWQQLWSLDGQSWLPGATFEAPFQLRRVGPEFIHKGSSSSAHHVSLDWFRVGTTEGVDPDGLPFEDDSAPWVYRSEARALGPALAVVDSWADEAALHRVHWGLTRECLAGVSELSGGIRTSVLVDGLPEAGTIYFRAETLDTMGNRSLGPVLELKDRLDADLAPVFAMEGVSPAAPGHWEITTGVPGDPQRLTGISGRLLNDAGASWNGLVTLTARLDGGPWTSLGVAGEVDSPVRLTEPGSFRYEVPTAALQPGQTHLVELLATPSTGGSRLARLHWQHASEVWPLPWALMLDGDAAGAGILEVDGAWDVISDPTHGAVLVNHEFGYARSVSLGQRVGDAAWDDFGVTLRFLVEELDPAGYTPGTHSHSLGFGLRWQGHNPVGSLEQPAERIHPLGGVFYHRWYDDHQRWQLWHGEEGSIEDWFSGPLLELGVPYDLRAEVVELPDGGATYSVKLWEVGSPEPNEPQLTFNTPAGDPIDTGSFALIAHHLRVKVLGLEAHDLGD